MCVCVCVCVCVYVCVYVCVCVCVCVCVYLVLVNALTVCVCVYVCVLSPCSTSCTHTGCLGVGNIVRHGKKSDWDAIMQSASEGQSRRSYNKVRAQNMIPFSSTAIFNPFLSLSHSLQPAPIIACNHVSLLDPLVIVAEFGRVSFVAKKTVAAVPLLGQVMTAVRERE